LGVETGDFALTTGQAGLGYRALPPTALIVTSSIQPPEIDGQGTYIEVKTDPYWIYLSYGQFTQIRYDLHTPGDVNADVVVKLLHPGKPDFDDSSAIEIFSGSVAPGEHDLQWTGLLSSDTQANASANRTIGDSGAFIFAIKATVNGASTIYKGAISAYQ
jgi:hypothetical protein